jgi:hypothetical protein
MNMRKITSLTALLSFVLLIVTSVILYVMPSGRVAYWSNWKLWGMSKDQWAAVHLNLGVLLLLAIVLHTWYNWKPIVSYLKTKAKKIRVFTLNFNIALVLTLAVFLGTLYEVPPLSTIVRFGASITDDANLFYGEPPYGHAELSPLSDFTSKVKLDLESSMEKLAAAGIKVESPAWTIQEIGLANNISPQVLYNLMKPEKQSEGNDAGMPEEAPGGTGNRTLAKICEMYKLDPVKITEGLAAQGIKAEGAQTMKEIAAANSLDPNTVYGEIYKLTR